MPGLLTQLTLLNTGKSIEEQARGVLGRFQTDFDRTLASFDAFNQQVAAAGFDAATQAEIDGLTAQVVSDAITQLETRLTQLQAIQSG